MSYEAVYAWSNLISAFQKASRGKRAKPYVAAFEHGLESNLLGLQDELRKETYLPGGYESFHIHEPKRRLISAAGFRDRVVHHALCNVIEPVFERSFVSASYANRKGRGTHRALDRAQECARRFRYVLQCDLRQFFPSVDHGVLRQILGAKIRDTQIMRLIALILRSGEGVFDGEYSMTWFAGDDLLSAIRPRGLPIGNLTSQFWANCCLNPFDHFVTRELRCMGYVRYVDDFLLFGDDKNTLWRWLDEVRHRLGRLRLALHDGAHPRPVSEGIPFLGFTISPERRRLKRRKGIHFQRKFRRLTGRARKGEAPWSQVRASVSAWVNHVSYANTVGLRRSVLGKTVG